jgi:hypothetical protein
MDALRRAVAAGYRDASLMIRDADLRPLRSREDFRALAGDLGFPSDPFARPDRGQSPRPAIRLAPATAHPAEPRP